MKQHDKRSITDCWNFCFSKHDCAVDCTHCATEPNLCDLLVVISTFDLYN